MIKSQKFTNYKGMAESAVNWEHHCSYQLTTKAHFGAHHVIQLPSILLSYTEREGGMMHEVSSPTDAFSIAVIQRLDDKACFGNMKLHTGDILFFDDSQFYNFMSSSYIKVAIISLPKDKIVPPLKTMFSKKLLGHSIQDTGGILSQILENILKECLRQEDDTQQRNTYYTKAEASVITLLTERIRAQEASIHKLTKGEKIALDIRERLYGHMDAKISIATLAKEYKVTEKTLQNAFTSLFGFTPKRFLQLMKLNHVHHELKESSPVESSVSRIAMKWGFTHMGSFSKYYTNLFGQNPSITLKTDYSDDGAMQKECADRQEEIT